MQFYNTIFDFGEWEILYIECETNFYNHHRMQPYLTHNLAIDNTSTLEFQLPCFVNQKFSVVSILERVSS